MGRRVELRIPARSGTASDRRGLQASVGLWCTWTCGGGYLCRGVGTHPGGVLDFALCSRHVRDVDICGGRVVDIVLEICGMVQGDQGAAQAPSVGCALQPNSKGKVSECRRLSMPNAFQSEHNPHHIKSSLLCELI